MNIQDEAAKIHSKYGISEMANYKIQLLCEAYHQHRVESEKKKSLLGRNNDLVEYSEGYKLGFMKGRAFEKELLKQEP